MTSNKESHTSVPLRSESDELAQGIQEDTSALVGSEAGAPELAVNTSPTKVVQARMTERHRYIFNMRMFPSLFEDGKLKPVNDHPETSPFSSDMNQSEWQEAVDIVQFLGPRKKKDANEEQLQFRKKLPFATLRKWVKKYDGAPLIDKYKVEKYKLPRSDQVRYRLLRRHKRLNWTEERWLICLPQLEVFDAIQQCHIMVSHMKQNHTCVMVWDRFYNVTEKQVNAFVETCEVCNHANPIIKPLKGAMNPILSENFRDRSTSHNSRCCKSEMFTSASSSAKSIGSLATSIFGNIETDNSLFTTSDEYTKVIEKRKLMNQEALNANEKIARKLAFEPLHKSKEEIVTDRRRYSESKDTKKLISSISVPVLKLESDEEINHGILKSFSRQCRSIMDDSGVLILNCGSGISLIPSEIMSAMETEALNIISMICKKLTEKGIVYHAKEVAAKQSFQSCSADNYLQQEQQHSFKFDEVASRCLGRLDIRHNMSKEPFNHKEIVDNEIMMSAVRSILGADAVLVYAGIVVSFPSSSDQPWHQDGQMLFPENELADDFHLPAYALNVFIPLTDISEEIGPTEFCVGSHVLQASKASMQHIAANELSKAKVIGPLLKKGDVLIYDYRTCHRGTQNLSMKETRTMLYLMYARPWFREHLNFGKNKLFD